jgi:hypothetical protein
MSSWTPRAADGLEVWCGHATWTEGSSVAELIAAANLALPQARRQPACTVVG